MGQTGDAGVNVILPAFGCPTPSTALIGCTDMSTGYANVNSSAT